jgi:threonine aldolase
VAATVAFVDLRSDTVTRPTPAMRRAMADAPVGDDVYQEDPTVNLLQERVAALLGKQSALFVPSGVMANQLAVHTHTRPGDEVLIHEGGHILHYEGGAAAALSMVQLHALPGLHGVIDPRDVRAAIRPPSEHFARTSLLAVENTHNRAGGTIWPLEALEAAARAAHGAGLAVHLDGARLRVLLEGSWGSGGLGPRGHGLLHRRGPPSSQAVRRGHAPGRHHRRRRPLRA